MFIVFIQLMKITTFTGPIIALLMTVIPYPALAAIETGYCEISAAGGSTLALLIHLCIAFLLFRLFIGLVGRFKSAPKDAGSLKKDSENKRALRKGERPEYRKAA